MPGLVPVNHTIFLANQSPQAPLVPQAPLTDAQLYQNLENQILIVKEIQGILDKEQIKLESLMKELERRKFSKRPKLIKSFEKSKEIIHVRSPFAINNNLSMKCMANNVDKEIDIKQDDEILDKTPVDKPNIEACDQEERFRNFWSGLNHIDEDVIKEEYEDINIEQLLDEEMKKNLIVTNPMES